MFRFIERLVVPNLFFVIFQFPHAYTLLAPPPPPSLWCMKLRCPLTRSLRPTESPLQYVQTLGVVTQTQQTLKHTITTHGLTLLIASHKKKSTAADTTTLLLVFIDKVIKHPPLLWVTLAHHPCVYLYHSSSSPPICCQGLPHPSPAYTNPTLSKIPQYPSTTSCRTFSLPTSISLFVAGIHFGKGRRWSNRKMKYFFDSSSCNEKRNPAQQEKARKTTQQ